MSTKPRELSSIENGLAEAIRLLKDEGVEKATGKSSSFIRKCSDPSLDQQIDHKDSAKIDIECVKLGLGHPLLATHQYIVAKELEKISGNFNDIDDLLVKFTILHGKLINKIKSSQEEESSQGEKITATEKKEIFSAISNLEKKIVKIKQVIEKS